MGMKGCFKSAGIALLLTLITGCFSKIAAQSGAIIPHNEFRVYEWIDRLQDRGHLSSLNPERLPYNEKELFSALQQSDKSRLSKIEQVWFKGLERFISRSGMYNRPGSQRLRFNWQSGMAVNTTRRTDVYRPVNNGDAYVRPFAQLRALYQLDNLLVNADLLFDYQYEQDPDGIDATNRWYTRNENSYIGYAGNHIKVYMGRFDNQWGRYEAPAAFLSDNPHTIDQLNLTIGSGTLSFQQIYMTLDGMTSDSTFTGTTRYDREAVRRFVAIRRLDWRVSDNFQLSYKESLMHSGYNAVPELKYLVPGTVFAFLEGNTPYDDNYNLLMGGSIWFRAGDLTMRSELLIDDIIFGREERGITERGNFVFNTHATWLLRRIPADLEFTSEVVSYQAYNTDNADGRYLFLERGLASQFNDYVFNEVKLNWYAEATVPGLRLSPYAGLMLQGEQDINQDFDSDYPDGSPYEFTLTGTEEKTLRVGVDMFYTPSPWFWIKADIGMNMSRDLDHIQGADKNRLVGMIEAGFRYDFSLGIN